MTTLFIKFIYQVSYLLSLAQIGWNWGCGVLNFCSIGSHVNENEKKKKKKNKKNN